MVKPGDGLANRYMAPSTIRAVIFDVDGVLVNAERFSDRFAREHGIAVERITPFFTGTFADCLIGRADLKDVIVPYLSEWGWTTGVDSFLEYWFTSEHSVNVELVDVVQSIRMQGVKCVVATNNEKHRVEYMSSSMDFSKTFDKLYASSHVGFMKPDPAFYRAVLEDLQVAAEEALFFDDSHTNVTAAAQLGMNAELYTTFERFQRTLGRYAHSGLATVADVSGSTGP